MQSELWNTAVWSSPSAEEDVRARVRKRAKSIRRWHRVPSAAALVLVGALVVPQLSGGQASTTMRVASEPDADEQAVDEQAPDGDAPSPTSTSAPSATTSSTTTTTTRPRSWDPTRSALVDLSPDSPPRMVDRTPGKPLVADNKDDAWDRDWCEAPHCRDETRTTRRISQPALDILSLDVRCTATAVVFATAVLDAKAAPLGSPAALTYGALFSWDDGPTNGPTGNSTDGWLEVALTRHLSSGEISVTGRTMTYNSGMPYAKNISNLRGRLEGNVFVVEVPFDAWAEAARSMFPDRKQPARDTRITYPGADSRKDSVGVDSASDQSAQPTPPSYTLCR